MDKHVVRARVDGAIVRLDIEPCTYEEALAHWHRLVGFVFPAKGKGRKTVLLAGEVNRGITVARECSVAWFDVRSVNHPGVMSLPVVKLRVLKPGGAKDERTALRRVGEATGFHSHEGGWIYRGPAGHKSPMQNLRWRPGVDNPECQITNHQGWISWAICGMRHVARDAVVRVQFKYYRTEEV